MSAQIKKIKRYSVDLVENNPNCLFIFGDNLIEKGTAGQAQIRHCANVFGIPTKKLPSNTIKSFFNDSEYDQNINYIKNAIDRIPNSYKYIVFPEDGIGTGLAQLPTKAPKTYAFLVNLLNEKFGNVYGI